MIAKGQELPEIRRLHSSVDFGFGLEATQRGGELVWIYANDNSESVGLKRFIDPNLWLNPNPAQESFQLVKAGRV